MSQISCSFCTNVNPPDAKFCNQCGSPLGLKPCPACEAVNETAAERCHQCGAAFDVVSPEITSSLERSPAREATEKLSEQMSPVADQSLPAAPFTVDAVEDAPIHIPESFADRLERDAGPHAFERVEPRIAHVEDHDQPQIAHAEDRNDSWIAQADDRDAPEAVSQYLRSASVRPRGRAWRAPLTLAVLVAIAGAGYYAYTRDVPGFDRLAEFVGRHAGAPASVESGSSESRAAAPVSGAPVPDVSSKPTEAAQNASQSASATTGPDASASDLNPASAALVSVQPGAPGQPQTDEASMQEQVAGSTQSGASSANRKARPSAAPSRNDDEAARPRTDAASRSRRQAEADAIATQRLIARDLGLATAPAVNAPAAPLDRDAAATQRLIERDLGPFRHRNDRNSKGGSGPAIN